MATERPGSDQKTITHDNLPNWTQNGEHNDSKKGICYHCGKDGHHIAQYWKVKREQQQKEVESTTKTDPNAPKCKFSMKTFKKVANFCWNPNAKNKPLSEKDKNAITKKPKSTNTSRQYRVFELKALRLHFEQSVETRQNIICDPQYLYWTRRRNSMTACPLTDNVVGKVLIWYYTTERTKFSANNKTTPRK